MSEETPGLISVVIPVYNGERFLKAAVESVLDQDYIRLEVIVVDDGSTDSSGTIARSFDKPVTCISQVNAGLGAARNAGIQASRGEFLAFLDADDLWTSDKLASQVKRLNEVPELECIFGLVDHFQDEDISGRFVVNVAGAAVGPVAGTMLIRRESLERVGLFATDRRLGEFIDWWARARDAGLRYEILPQVALRRRVHGANMTITQSANHSDYLHVLKAALDRRRAAQ